MCKSEHETFYNLIKFWTLNDFCTPSIKAEVIFDMLLSPFITDIVKVGKKIDGPLILLAKEFPLKLYQDNKGPKIDYLLMDDSTDDLYIVELKTDNKSFNTKQYNNYTNVQTGKNIGDNFYKIIKDNTLDKYYKNFKTAKNVKGSNKYIKMLYQIASILEDKLPVDVSHLSKNELAKEIQDYLNKQNVHIVYLSIEEIKVGKARKSCEEVYSEIKNIHLDNIEMYDDVPEKKALWSLVHNIITATYKEGTFANMWKKDLIELEKKNG